jgi:cbb3-type cytochrome oxidase maturation protein
MEVLFILIPVSLLLIGLAIAAFLWAVDSGQFEDLDRQGYEILFGDDERGRQDPAEGEEEK